MSTGPADEMPTQDDRAAVPGNQDAPGRAASFSHPSVIRSLESASRPAPTGLPLPASSFVGRGSEVAAVSELLQTARLVTVTGPGGCGKTRLAVEVARGIASRFEDGVVFVSLASLDDPGLVATAIAHALDVRESSARSSWESVALALASKHLLLVLDNLEHLIDAAEQMATWLSRCPTLTLLTTSRERLRLQGEMVYPLPPLTVPEAAGAARGTAAPISSDAVRLFTERAEAVEPSFRITEHTAPVVAEICRRLDGLPLAIELAAARIRLLSPEAMLERLRGATGAAPLELLSGGTGELPVRQQTLRQTIAWSYELLSGDEQRLFRQLSVFADGCTLEAIAAVCAVEDGPGARAVDGQPPNPPADAWSDGSDLILDLVGALTERSLLQPLDAAGDEPRFGMLATIREFAREQLAASGEAAAVFQRHAAYYVMLAEHAAPRMHGSLQVDWFDRLDAEHNDLRTAMAWTAQHDLPAALRLGGALWRFWQVRGHVREGREWLERIILAAEANPTATAGPERASALNAAAFLAFLTGDYPLAIQRHRETLAIRRALGDREGVAESLNSLGLVLRCAGERDGVDALFEESLTISRQLGNRARQANTLNNLARATYYRGDLAAAQALHEQALTVGREAGEVWAVAICLGDLGDVLRAQGDAEAARRLYLESLEAWSALGDARGVAQCLEGFAGLRVEDRPDLAVRLFSAAAALREVIGEPCSRVRQHEIDQTLDTSRQALGAARFSAAWAEGQALTPTQAIEAAQAAPTTD